MAGLAIIKHSFDLSDEELCARWVENPYFQYFCGEEFFCHELPFDRSSMTRWRQRMGEERMGNLLQDELGGRGEDGCDEAFRYTQGYRRHDSPAQERDVPDRCQADQPGTREAGEPGQEDGDRPASVLCAGGQAGARGANAGPRSAAPVSPGPSGLGLFMS
jgi:hypothetical protein